MEKTNVDVKEAIEAFLEDWDRQEWMQEYGEWASEEWEEERVAYSDAVDALAEAVNLLDQATDVDSDSLVDVESAIQKLHEAVSDLEGQVRPDESDYIAEGRLDPDYVADRSVELGVHENWQGWDCIEGWDAYRCGDALVLRWRRSAWGAWVNRHDRDLWVTVDEDFFQGACND